MREVKERTLLDVFIFFRNLQKALAIYGGAGGTGGDTPVKPKDEQVAELEQLIRDAKLFAKDNGTDLDTVHDGTTLERLAKLKAAREARIFPDETRRKYLAMAGRIERLFKAIGLDERVDPFAKNRDVIKLVAQSIKANIPPPDISQVMQQVEHLLDESIDAHGYVIPEPTRMRASDSVPPVSRRVDLSQIDFDALKAFFDKSKSQRATLNSLQQAATSKVDELVRQNPTRRDLYEKLQTLIEEYNAGSQNVQESFEQLKEFIESLNQEEQRHVKEGLSVEELAIFDLLTKPSVELTKKDRQRVKALSKDLLSKLKADKLVIDWRKKARRKAGVRACIQDVLDALPDAYSDDLYDKKCGQVRPGFRARL